MTDYKCLIVDDSPMMRQLLSFAMHRVKDMTVDEADDGVRALKKIEKERFDIVIADINMPVIDGFKLIKYLRSDAVHRDVPIVVVSTEYREEDKRRAYSLGATAYLTKPIQAVDLIATVKSGLKISV